MFITKHMKEKRKKNKTLKCQEIKGESTSELEGGKEKMPVFLTCTSY